MKKKKSTDQVAAQVRKLLESHGMTYVFSIGDTAGDTADLSGTVSQVFGHISILKMLAIKQVETSNDPTTL